MTEWHDKNQAKDALIIESGAAGIAFGALLGWGSVCLVAIFRPYDLAMPYWASFPGLRTDTTGALAFVVAAISIVVSEYLRLRRRRYQAARSVHFPNFAQLASDSGTLPLMAQAVSRAVMILAAGLVVYLSFNTITHPATETIQVTHLLPWPTEGTVRILALILAVIAVGVRRYFQQSALLSAPAPAVADQHDHQDAVLQSSAATDA